MTDLVSQLVAQLEDMRGKVIELCQTYGNALPHGSLERTDAALTAAKAGGWLPIETAPRGSGIDGPDSVSHPDYVHPPKLLLWTEEGPLVGYYDWYYHPGYGRGAEDGESVWRDHSGARTYGATAWQPLPTPPKDQA